MLLLSSEMTSPAYKTDRVNCTKNVCFHRSDSTGKEKDSETGYGYFGARYMDHELMTMWLSVDPMADKYPSISPYAYCAWSPVRLVDPNGEEDVMLVYVWFQATKYHRSGGGKITVSPGQASKSVFLGAFSK